MRVLILGGRAPVALDHARRLHAQGATIFVGDSASCRLSTFADCVTAHVRLPAPRSAGVEFADQLGREIQRLRIDLVLPTCEEAFYVSRWRSRLPIDCAVLVAPFDTMRVLHSKLAFQQLARECGGDPPASARVMSLHEAGEWAAGRPVVLKPEYSRFGVHVRLYPRGIETGAPELPVVGPWVVQDFRFGRELCTYSIARDGQLTAFSAYEPAYRLSRSSSYYFDPVDAPALRHCVERFVQLTRYTGQLSFDWILGPDGAASMLECNPRASSGLHLFSQTDRLLDSLSADGTGCVQPGAVQPMMLAPVMATAGLAQAMRARTVGRWWRDWRRARDVIMSGGGYRSIIGGGVDIAAFAVEARRHGCSLREAATGDIEWDGEDLPA